MHDISSDEDRLRKKLKYAVIYIPNPIHWASVKWNMAKLRNLYDPTFNENDFLVHAAQVLSVKYVWCVFFMTVFPYREMFLHLTKSRVYTALQNPMVQSDFDCVKSIHVLVTKVKVQLYKMAFTIRQSHRR